MGAELTNNGEKLLKLVTSEFKSVNQLKEESGLNWHTVSRELAILAVLDKVHCEIFKKPKKDQWLYKLKDDEVNLS